MTAQRYAMKQEVAAFGGEFLPSMSDFKPGDKNTVDMLDAPFYKSAFPCRVLTFHMSSPGQTALFKRA